jgi:hypothetical protein
VRSDGTTDVIIRGVPEHILKEIDSRAAAAYQSRQAYLLSLITCTAETFVPKPPHEWRERTLVAYTWEGGKYTINSKCLVTLTHESGPQATEAELRIIERAKIIAESGNATQVEWARDFLEMHGFEGDVHPL